MKKPLIVLASLLFLGLLFGCQFLSLTTVTYNANGATGGSVPMDINIYQKGSTVTVLANTGNLFKTDYNFAGWNIMADGTGTSYAASASFLMGTANVTLYAIWIPSNLTFTSSGTSITITGYITKPSGSLTIPGGGTSIGSVAFNGCSSLTSVTIPSSVTSIGENAFDRCTSLASITIPSSVTSIGWGAFEECTSLASITIPSSVTIIADSTFDTCTSLTSITIPSSVTSIGENAFDRCTNLASVTIPLSVTSIGWCAFEECTGLTSVTIPPSVTSIGNYTFEGCKSLTSVAILATTPPTLPLGSQAFCGCAAELQIHVPSGTIEAYETAPGWSDYYSPIDYFVSP